MRYFKKPACGLQSIARLTADEHHNLMKVIVFITDNLYKENTKNIKNFIKNKELVQLYETWNEMYEISRYEIFKKSDLDKFKKSIENWSQRFIKAFQSTFPFGLKLPKLHSWVYYIIDSIRSFGAINGYTTETYESLYKDYVKSPYRLSNKKNVETQIMQIQLIANVTSQSTNLTTTPQSNVNAKIVARFTNFSDCLNLYLSQLKNHKIITGENHVSIYGSVTLENGAIMHATNSYYNKPWFSNVSVHMNSEELFEYTSNQGICYDQVLLIVKIDIKEQNTLLNLALIQWYDFKSQSQPYLYGCPLLELTDIYNFIDIEAIQDVIHIIPRFDSINEYFINKYIF
ncbi:hypothetical protein C1645_818632 [Glomus cerebriforme]|uniref:Uncharacterized protein n=1 Tax=Glomus cerebriforme TaxID=658196 RepID=A0A397TG39_9GLOM|nr:hypothetical protein C1645_818632 [Glomus cerebriforme]